MMSYEREGGRGGEEGGERGRFGGGGKETFVSQVRSY